MAGNKGIRAGKAYVELYADNSKLTRGLKRASAQLKAFGRQVSTIGMKVAMAGAGLTTAFAATTKIFASMGDTMEKMSRRTGMSVESLSEMGFAAEQSGANLETLEKGIRTMQRSINDAGRGLSTQIDALTDLGLSYKDLADLSPEQQFKLLADKISQVEDPTKKAALAMMIFGRSGSQLLPMLENGSAGINELMEEARKLGLTMSSEDAKAAAELTDALNKLWKVVKMVVFHIGAALAPLIKDLVDYITNVVKPVIDWIQANKGLVVTIAKLSAIVLGAGAALMFLGYTIQGVGITLGLLLKLIVLTKVAVVGLVKMVGTGLAGAFTALISPIGLVIAALSALGIYMAYTTGALGKSVNWLGKKFGQLKSDATEAMGGIGDALASGNISLAAKILWLTIKMEWQKGTNAIKKLWLDAQYYLVAAWYGLKDAWLKIVAGIQMAWETMVWGFKRAWEGTGAWLAKKWAKIRGMFDESFDVDFALNYIDQDHADAVNQMNQEHAGKIRGINKETEAKRQALGSERDATLTALAQDNQEKMAANQEKLAAATKAWQDAIKTAKEGRNASPEDEPEKPKKPAMPELGDMGTTVQQRAASVVGTFNASAAGGLGMGDATERIATATQETARNTQRLLQLQQISGAAFA